MSNNKKDLAAVSDSLGMDEGYVLICKTDPIHKGVWSDPAEFVWAIGEYGRKIILVGFLSDNFTPEQIAKVFCHGKFHKELSVQHDQLFICNNHDIVNAQKYMNEKGNVEFQQKFNEQNRKDWEQVPEQKLEVTMWMLELQKGTYFFPFLPYTVSPMIYPRS